MELLVPHVARARLSVCLFCAALRTERRGGRARRGGGQPVCAGVAPVLGHLGHPAGGVLADRLRLHWLRTPALGRVSAQERRVLCSPGSMQMNALLEEGGDRIGIQLPTR
jgi:hypothetical protein